LSLPITQFAESSGGIGALGIDAKALIIQLVSFVLAFWILQRFAFKPIVKLMNERRLTIEKGVALGEQMQKDKAALEQKIEETMHKARQQADGIIAQAHDTARQVAAEVEAKASAKADGIVKSAEERIKQDTARARQKLESELVGLISDATEAIIDEKVDAKKDAALLDRAMKGNS
jgi:F-type H+-transporting ATPase subunit b